MKIELGYQIDESASQEKKALDDAFQILIKARQAGANMRSWAKKTTYETQALVHRLSQKGPMTTETKLWELSCWESKILGVLRSYMSLSADLLNDLKPLNPPLRTEQLKPFVDAISMDRDNTVDALAALTKSVEQLTALRLDLNRDGTNIFEFRHS